MCGIAGVVDWDFGPAEETVQMMVQRVRHRGPDFQQVLVRGKATLGHARLSIIDISTAANQPMADGEGRRWVVFNGEIYNHRELRSELESQGARFRTHSDTEVILAAYEKWGERCMAHFNGMFAFALWDELSQRLLLGRDRMGKKPLFYYQTPTGFVFASELPALQCHPQVPDEIDGIALCQFLSLGYILNSECISRGVRKLPPAHYLVVEQDKPLRPQRYWALAPFFHNKKRHRSEDEALEELDALFRDAVKMRLESDVPLGAFLSGGIDSSLTVGAMRRELPQLNTFSSGFSYASFNEAPQARRVAEYLGVDHHDQVVPDNAALDLQQLMAYAGEPFADTSLIPTYDLCQFARRHVTVCLSGDGGDELFAGYETYIADRLHRWSRAVPAVVTAGAAWAAHALIPVSFDKVSLDYKLRQFLTGCGLDFPRAHYSWRTLFTTEESHRLLHPEHTHFAADPFSRFAPFFEEVLDCHYLDQAAYVDINTWLVDDIMVKVDRASMAHALEVRAPFLDYRVVEFSAALPVNLKLQGFKTKYLLKRLHDRYFPTDLRQRKKRGFNAPVSYWFAGARREAAYTLTTFPAMLEWIDRKAVEDLWADHLAKRCDNGHRLFALACLGAWFASRRPATSAATIRNINVDNTFSSRH